jgi:hypothetical protein
MTIEMWDNGTATTREGASRLPRQVTLMDALYVLAIRELRWGEACVSWCAPTEVEVSTFSNGTEGKVRFKGDEADMRPLVLAAQAVREKSVRAAERARRDYAGYQTVTSPDGGVAMALSGFARDAVGRKLATDALLAASEMRHDAEVALANELGVIGFYTVLRLRNEGFTVNEAGDKVRAALAALRPCYRDADKAESALLRIGHYGEGGVALPLELFVATVTNQLWETDEIHVFKKARADGVSFDEAAKAVFARKQAEEAARPRPPRRGLLGIWDRIWDRSQRTELHARKLARLLIGSRHARQQAR